MLDPQLLAQKAEAEKALRAAVDANPSYRSQWGDAWDNTGLLTFADPGIDSSDDNDLGQEEIYIALDGSATLLVDGGEHVLKPGVLARVGPGEKRRIVPGPDGFRMVAVGGRPGEAYTPPAWTELGGPLPQGP